MSRNKKVKRAFLSACVCALVFGCVGGGVVAYSVNDNGTLQASAAEKSGVIEVGKAYAHENGGTANGFYFATKGTDAVPFDSSWALEYYPVSTDSVKLVRGGVTYHIAMTNRPIFVKYGANDYYFKAEAWSIGDYAPLQNGDTVILDGQFTNAGNGATFQIEETSVIYQNGFFSFSTDEDNSGSIFVEAGNAYAHFNGLTESGLYFSMDANEIPYGTAWEVRYKPETAAAVKLFRGGQTYTVGHNERETIVKYSEKDYYFEGWTLADKGPLTDGDILLLDGTFINVAKKAKFVVSPTYILIEEGKATFVADYGEYLYGKLRDAYGEGNYEYENVLALREIMTATQNGMQATNDVWEMNALYENAVTQLDVLPLNEDAAAELAAAKANAKEGLSSFVDLDDYDAEEKNLVVTTLARYLEKIDEALSAVQIDGIFETAKTELDLIKTRTDKREEAILSGADGWEEYLETYNVVSLRDLNLGDEYVFTQKEMAEMEDFNALDTRYNNLYNTFAPAEGNTTGSVVYKFIYNTNFAGGDNNLCLHVKLRGIMYYGYRFTLGWSTTNILKVQRGESDANTQTLYEPDNYVKGLLTSNQDHLMEFGAIDIKDSDRTWVYAKIDGNLIVSAFCDSLPFGDAPRVDVRAEYKSTGDLTTKVTFKNVADVSSEPTKINGGRLQYNQDRSDDRAIYGALAENEMPYASDKSVGFYPADENAVKLLRDGETVAVADIQKMLLYKYTETDYFFALADNGVQIQDGDVIVIDGDFIGFREDTYEKLVLHVKKVEFTYDGATKEWKQTDLTLDELKDDAADTVRGYESLLALYDESDRAALLAEIEDGLTKLAAAETADGVAAATADVQAAFKAVKTTFEKYQESKKAEIKAYKQDLLSGYRAAEQAEIEELKTKACIAIDKATERGEVDEAVVEAIAEIDALQTDEALSAEELAYAKQEGIKRIQAAYGMADFHSSTQEEKDKINAEYLAALDGVEKATTVAEVEAAVSAFTDKYLKVAKKKDGCGSVMASLGGLTALLGVSCVVFKKKENH